MAKNKKENKKNISKKEEKEVKMKNTLPATSKKEEKPKNKVKKVKGSKKSYVAEVKEEVKKVRWPSKQDLVKYGIAVIIFIILFGVYFYAFDALFAWITSLIKGL